MALSFFPEFNSSLELEYSGGETLFKEVEALNELSEKLGIAKLSDFADNREVSDDYEGDPEDLAEEMGEWNEWFPAQKGLEVVSKLLTTLPSHKNLFDQKSFDILLKDLRELELLLKQASQLNIQFRLQVF